MNNHIQPAVKLSIACLTLSATALLSGCGTSVLSQRVSNPVIQDFAFRWLSRDSALSTTASRRLALMSYRLNSNNAVEMVTCAEPPPDVGETLAKAIAAQLELRLPRSTGNAEAGAKYGQEVATALAPLMVRSQGLQVLRDTMFTLCIDKMNGWITNEEKYIEIKQARFKEAIQLIKDELPSLQKRVETATVGPPAQPKPIELPQPTPGAASEATATPPTPRPAATAAP